MGVGASGEIESSSRDVRVHTVESALTDAYDYDYDAYGSLGASSDAYDSYGTYDYSESMGAAASESKPKSKKTTSGKKNPAGKEGGKHAGEKEPAGKEGGKHHKAGKEGKEGKDGTKYRQGNEGK